MDNGVALEEAPTAEAPLEDINTVTGLLEGVTRWYTTPEVAKFLDRSNPWMYWAMREHVFVYPDGEPLAVGDTVVPTGDSRGVEGTVLGFRDASEAPDGHTVRVKWKVDKNAWEEAWEAPGSLRKLIEPLRQGLSKKGKRRFSPEVVREMALACHRRGLLKENGYWEARTSFHTTLANGRRRAVKHSARGYTPEEAEAAFVRKYGTNPDSTAFVMGLREVLLAVARAEREKATAYPNP